MASIHRKTLQELMLAHLRISRAAGIEADLLLVNGEEPNAFAGLFSDRRVIGVSLGMVKLIGDDINQYAALLGHEAAHWSKGHIDASSLRANTLKVIGTVVGAGLGAAGVPAGGLITGVGLDLIDASFNRDQERDADAASVDYVIANNYDPQGAITLFEKMMKNSSRFSLPFLSSHPSDQERIERFKALIESKRPPQSESAAH
jgi:predicted Zn-dependent protease